MLDRYYLDQIIILDFVVKFIISSAFKFTQRQFAEFERNEFERMMMAVLEKYKCVLEEYFHLSLSILEYLCILYIYVYILYLIYFHLSLSTLERIERPPAASESCRRIYVWIIL